MKKANITNPPRNNSTCICVMASKKNATDIANNPPPRISILPAFPFALSKYFLKKGSVRSGSNERTNMSLQLPKLVINPAATALKHSQALNQLLKFQAHAPFLWRKVSNRNNHCCRRKNRSSRCLNDTA